MSTSSTQQQQSHSYPKATFNTLPYADGSATYSWQGYSIVCAVNGPIEAQRRDERAEQAFIEVNLKPISGPGGPHDRRTETLLHSILTSLILVTEFPRSLIQISLQILLTPSSAWSVAPPAQTSSILPALPHLLHTAVLALCHANIPLHTTATSICVGVDSNGTSRIYPQTRDEAGQLTSVHVFGFTGAGDSLLALSEGAVGLEEWERASEFVEKLCCGTGTKEEQCLQNWLRETVTVHIEEKTSWRTQ